jgi:hypothetical protein
VLYPLGFRYFILLRVRDRRSIGPFLMKGFRYAVRDRIFGTCLVHVYTSFTLGVIRVALNVTIFRRLNCVHVT